MQAGNISAVIIDDESSSRSALRQKLKNYCASVSVIAECESGEEGIDVIEQQRPDLIFLDVEMPRLNGFTMLQQLKNRDVDVIFVTAYNHYAIQAIRFCAMDYLVKPVNVEDLRQAVERVMEKRKSSAPNAQLELLMENLVNDRSRTRRIAIPTTSGLQFVRLTEIIYLEASANYTRFHLQNEARYTVCKTMKEFEDILPADLFVRIHHSFIISKNYVESYIRGDGGQVVLSNGVILEVSKRKKADFLRAIGE